MRLLLAALVLVVLCGSADAQPSRAPAGPSQTPTLPAIGLPLPPIGLPLPAIGLPPSDITASSRATTPPRGDHRGRGQGRRGRTTPSVVYVVPAYGWSSVGVTAVPGTTPAAAPAERPPARTSAGTLRLDLQPRVAGQVFVDGAYVGTLDDLGPELTLAAGRRQVEVRHPGYESLVLPVQIDDGRALVYRGALVPAAAKPAPAAPPPTATASPIVRKPFYFIPGCYLGDVPPKDAGLPASCDLSRVVVFRP